MTLSKSPEGPSRLALIVLMGLSIGCQAGDAGSPASDPYELVFVSDRDGAGLDVYIHTLGREAFTRITADSGQDYGPVWSPDGDRILFNSDIEGNSEIFLMGADGSGRANLSNFEGHDGGGGFSPDGSEILFSSTRDAVVEGHSGRDLWVMNADGSNPRRLTTNDMYDDSPRFSPDGEQIAFCRQLPPEAEGGASNGDVFVMDRDGSGERRITSAATFDCLAHWSPDGRLAFHGCDADGCRLFVVSADGGEPTLIPTEHPANWPVWSPDGQWIAYTATHDDQTDIWLVRPDGSETRQVTTHPGRDEVAAWRPAR